MNIIRSHPKLNQALIEQLEQLMHAKFDYPSIPDDYKSFLMKNNGGYVVPGYVEDNDKYEHSEEIVFDTPLKWSKDNDRAVMPCIVIFFGVWLPEDMNLEEVEDDSLYDLIASNEHSKFDFEVLPDRMMSIAKCSHPDASDILCISLTEEDYGSIYYYYGMWDFPAKWHGSYYDDKISDIFNKYNIEDYDDIDEDTVVGNQIIAELDRVPFVKVANSFSEFLGNCKIKSVQK